MRGPARTRLTCLATVLWIAVGGAGTAGATGAQAFDTARELYAAARYEEALAVLDELRSAPGDGLPAVPGVEQYRSLCLLALGRAEEAAQALAAIVAADPLYQPDEHDTSPRLRAAFRDVRRRLLPSIASREYADAKAVFDAGDYPEAIRAFERVLRLVEDADMQGRLADLTLLATGFADLAKGAAAPPPELPEPPPPAPAPDPTRVYGPETPEVSPPVPVRQPLPRIPQGIVTQVRSTGTLELVVSETGDIEEATLQVGMHPIFDRMLLEAAREWKYEPATFAGQPVKFRKTVRILSDMR